MFQKILAKLRKTTAVTLSLLMLLSFSLNAIAATITVDTLNDTGSVGDCELRDAINSANANAAFDNCTPGEASPVTDVIDFSVNGTINLNGTQLPTITEAVEIDGDNNNDNVPDITIDAAANSRILDVNAPDVTVRGFSFLNGASAGGTGGSVLVQTGAKLTLQDSSFDNSGVGLGVTTNGGAIGAESDSNLDIDNTNFQNTSAEAGGAIYMADETVNVDTDDDDLIISNSTFDTTSATTTHGGAVYIGDNNEATIQSTTINNSQAARKGGAVYHAGETTPPPTNNLNLKMTGLGITNSTANVLNLGDEGGGLYIGTNAETTATGLTIDNASAYLGGGVFLSPAGILNMGTGSSITNSTAEFGGGVYMSNAVDFTTVGELLTPIIIDNNTANSGGGGIYINDYGSNLNITYTNITNNDTLDSGGGMRVGTGDTVTAFSSIISDNTAGINGGGIYTIDNYGAGENKPINLSYVQMDGNTAVDGGAIFAGNRTDLELDNVTSSTTPNQATGSGGFLSLGSSGPDSSLFANNITISSNTANSCGAMTIGGAFTPATPALQIIDSTFSNNSATTFGGGVCLNAGALLIDNTQFINNLSGTNGGALFLNDNGSDSQTTLRNFSFFASNTATGLDGGDIFVSQNANNNELIVENGVFNTSSNIPMSQGGSIFNQQGTVDISDSSFTGSRLMTVKVGGAIYNDGGALTIDNTSFNTYLTTIDGAAIYSQLGNVGITNSSFNTCEATGNGGAIWGNGNNLNISGSTFDFSLASNGAAIYDEDSIINIDNSSFTNGDAASGGGAIYTNGLSTDLNITKSYFGQNEGGYGGAFYINQGDLSLINSTVESNDAVGGDGGGIYLAFGAAAADILSSTIANNHALAFGGGLAKSLIGPINMSNTILDGNTNTIGPFAGPDCSSSGQLSIGGFNLISSTSGCGGTFDPNDILDTSAQLDVLALNGGTTLNYALLSSSPAIDTGNSLEFDDQRGVARPQYAGTDIGSHEFQDTVAPNIFEVTPVTTPSTDTTPDYTFSSDEAGTINYGGGCSSVTTNAVVGPITVTFNALVPGTYSLCTISVTDPFGNTSFNLTVSAFTITTPIIPVIPPSGGGSSGGGSASFGQPASSGGAPTTPTTPTTTPPSNNPPSNNPPGSTTPVIPPSNNPPVTTPDSGTPNPSNPTTPSQPATNNNGNTNSNSTAQTPTTDTTAPTNPVDNSTPVDTNTATTTDFTTPANTITPNIQISAAPTASSVGNPENYQPYSLSRSSANCNVAVFQGLYHLEPGISMDSDGDGLSDAIECQISTDPTRVDTDKDGQSDGVEVLNLFTNPLQPGTFDPTKTNKEFVIVTLPEDSLTTGDDTPLFLGLAQPNRQVDVYIFTSTDFDEYRQQLQNTIAADQTLTPSEKRQAYNDQFNLTVASVLNKFINQTLDSNNPFEAKFIGKIFAAGQSRTDENGVFALESDTALRDSRYLVMGKSKNSYSTPVEFTLDSSLAFITPFADKLDGKTITADLLAGNTSLTINPGSSKPVLTGKVVVPSRIVAIWQSNITSSALLADSLDQEFRLTPPNNLEPGDHTVMLTAYRNSDNAQSRTLKIKFNIPAKSAAMPFLWWPYALAAILLIVIIALVLRRRQNTPELAQATSTENPANLSSTSVSAPSSPTSKLIDTQSAPTNSQLPHPFASIPPLDQGSTTTDLPGETIVEPHSEDQDDLLPRK